MNLAWLILSAAFELGGFTGGAVYDYDRLDGAAYAPPLYTTFSGEAQAGPAFVRGSVETVFFRVDDRGRPFDAIYTFGAGLYLGPLELGWSHFCAHPVESVGASSYQRLSGEADRIYLRASFGNKPKP